MAEDCCTPSGNIMILACSGCSNVGQLSNQAAVELTQEGFGKMFCLAGIEPSFRGLSSRRRTSRKWWSSTAATSAAPRESWNSRHPTQKLPDLNQSGN